MNRLAAVAILLSAVPVRADTAADRGKANLTGKAYVPPTWGRSAYENAWKHWGVDKKPADYAKRFFRERYGLHEAPYDNGGLPMGLREAPMPLLGKGVAITCLTCHGGSIFGKSYVGLGNSTLDFQLLYEELGATAPTRARPPFVFTRTRGTSEAGGMSVFLLGYREPNLNLRLTRRDLDLQDDLCEDAPAWWTLKKKKTMYHTGGADTRSVRSLMQFMMSPLNLPSAFHKAEADFKDIREYLVSLEAPKYPLPVDAKLADEGSVLFKDNCARCHGTYGAKWTYPNKIVPIKEIGTDRRRYDGISEKFGAYYAKTWFAEDYGPIASEGYQAPPLDGVWATAPYLHNGSVPTLYGVLDSKARPKVFTRSFATGREDYDEKDVGWKVSVLKEAPKGAKGHEARRVYDTTQPGRGNGGHTYGDKLTEAERRALVEYLKTL